MMACTEVTENYPEGCTPGTLSCIGNDISRCESITNEAGETSVQNVVFKQCPAEAACIPGDPPACGEGTVGPGCETDADCALEIGACYESFCDAGVCSTRTQADGTSCNDGNLCTESDSCADGFCSGALVSCDDGNPCTADSCDPASGCSVTNDNKATCDDGEPCTKSDSCLDGACNGLAVNCDDGNACTEDQCDAATGECVNIALTGSCDDGDECTSNDQCSLGECVGEPACLCDSADPTSCDQYNTGDPCKGDYTCLNDYCQLDPETAYQCDETNLGPCEITQCVNNEGEPECKTIAKETGVPCDDGSICTSDDLCQTGACVGDIDVTIPGCGDFRLGWFNLTGETMVWTTDQYILRGTVNYPQIFGKAQNDSYRVRAIGPGLGQ